MYKVIEVANMLKVSKVTIYKKIEILKNDLKPYLHKKKNITYIDSEGVELIKKSLNIPLKEDILLKENYEKEIQSLSEKLRERDEKLQYIEYQFNKHLIDSSSDVNSYIRTLENQIKVKKREIEHKDTLLKEFKELIRVNKNRIKYIEEILK